MGRGGGRSGGGGFSSGGSRGFSSHRSSGSSSRKSGSSSSGSSFSSSSSRRGGSGSYSRPTPPRPTPPPPSYYRPRRTTVIINNSGNSGDSSLSRSLEGRPQSACRRSGVKKNRWLPGWYKWVSILMLIMAIVLLHTSLVMSSTHNAAARKKLPADACISTNQWMDDQVNWISDKRTVTDAMKYFYDKTGVQPYLLICDTLAGKGGEITDEEARAALQERYDTLFNDEGHMIFTFMEYEESQYITWIYTGRSADTVIDEEAREIILNDADRFYTDSSLSDDQFFARIFKDSADTIMKDSAGDIRTAVIYATSSVFIFIILGSSLIIFKLREQKMKEREQIKDMLNTPIRSPESPEDQELMNKYGNKN